MPIIVTLTTDLGTSDYHVGAIKGAMLNLCPDLNLIDISHQIKNFDIVQAAFMLKNAYPRFPKGSIHVVWVDNTNKKHEGCLVFEHNGHFFIGPNNGIFSLMFESFPNEIFFMSSPVEGTFGFSNMLAEAVAKLQEHKAPSQLGKPIAEIEKRITLQPVVSKSQIRGSVIHEDNFGNLVVNVPQHLFEQVGNGRPFSVYFKRNDPICQLSKDYCDVPVGEILCLFNSAGLLEIAINKGKASGLLGLEVDDTIQIDFEEQFPAKTKKKA